MEIETFTDASGLLARVGDALDAGGAECELTLGLLRRLEVEPDAWGADVLLLGAFDDDGVPVAVMTKTGTYPVLITGFRDETHMDFAELARMLAAHCDAVLAVNGPHRFSAPLAEAVSLLTGVLARPVLRTKAFELRTLRPPREVDGAWRTATAADVPLLVGFVHEFSVEALPHNTEHGDNTPLVERLIAANDLVLWETASGPVSMAAINRRTHRSSCVSLVYTPPMHRGHGYASAVVAALSQRELDAGAAWVSLFTDAANPTSNHIYQQLGYEFRVDFTRFDLLAGVASST